MYTNLRYIRNSRYLLSSFNIHINILTVLLYMLENIEVTVTACLRRDEEKAFCLCLDEIRKRHQKKNYTIVKKSGIVKIPYTDILFVESSNAKCIFHLLDGVQYTIYEHLGKIELDLEVM